jgi:hypothetical protein
MKKINRDHRLTDRGSSPKEKSTFSIDVKGGEKSMGMKMKRRGMNIAGVGMSMRSVVSKCFHQCQRGVFLKD